MRNVLVATLTFTVGMAIALPFLTYSIDIGYVLSVDLLRFRGVVTVHNAQNRTITLKLMGEERGAHLMNFTYDSRTTWLFLSPKHTENETVTGVFVRKIPPTDIPEKHSVLVLRDAAKPQHMRAEIIIIFPNET
jgi:hypothetical protein